MIRLTVDDVVRHRLVKRIIMRYDEDDSRRRESRERGGDRDRRDRPRFRERGRYREEE